MFTKQMNSGRLEIRLDKMSITQLEQFVTCIVRNSCGKGREKPSSKSKHRDVTFNHPLTRARTTASTKWRETLLNVVARCTNRSKECVVPNTTRPITRKKLLLQPAAKKLTTPPQNQPEIHKSDFLQYFKLNDTQNYSVIVNNGTNNWKGHHPLHLLNTQNVPFSSDLGQKLTKECHHVSEDIHQRKIERIERYLTTVISSDTSKTIEYEISYNSKAQKNLHTYVFPTKIHRKRGRLSSKATFLLMNHCRPCIVKLEKLHLPRGTTNYPLSRQSYATSYFKSALRLTPSKAVSLSRKNGLMPSKIQGAPPKNGNHTSNLIVPKAVVLSRKNGLITSQCNQEGPQKSGPNLSKKSVPLSRRNGTSKVASENPWKTNVSSLGAPSPINEQNRRNSVSGLARKAHLSGKKFTKDISREKPCKPNESSSGALNSIVKKQKTGNWTSNLGRGVIPLCRKNGIYPENPNPAPNSTSSLSKKDARFSRKNGLREPLTHDVFRKISGGPQLNFSGGQSLVSQDFLRGNAFITKEEVSGPNGKYAHDFISDFCGLVRRPPRKRMLLLSPRKKDAKVEIDTTSETSLDSLTQDPLKCKENYLGTIQLASSTRDKNDNFMGQQTTNPLLVPNSNLSSVSVLKQNNLNNLIVKSSESILCDNVKDVLSLGSSRVDKDSEKVLKNNGNSVKRKVVKKCQNKIENKRIMVYETRSSVRVLRVRCNR